MRVFAIAMIVATLAFPVAALATETITYTYDHRGRLIQVVHSGTSNNGLTVTYTYDAAGNRVRVVTTGASH